MPLWIFPVSSEQGETGVQGPTGIAGATGVQGVQGDTGVQGNTGVAGDTGLAIQGETGLGVQGDTGLQGETGAGGAGADTFAATRIVSLLAAEGTDLTVAAAIAALPAAGGRIYVKQGTFALVATNSMPDKSVDIVGSGDGTVFSLGANAIAAFTIPNILTARRNYTFSHFSVLGTSVAAQRIVSIQDTDALGVVTIEGVNSTGIQKPISITAGDSSFVTPVFVTTKNCWFVPIADGTSALCDSNGISELINAAFYNVKFIVDDFSGVGGTINADSFGNSDYAFYDCDLSLTGEDGLSSMHCERCRIFNFSGTPEIFFLNGNFVSEDYLPQSAFIDCNVLGMFFVDSGGMHVYGGWWTNNRITTGLVNGRSTIIGVSLRADSTSAATMPTSGGNTTFINHSGQDLSVMDCSMTHTGVVMTNYIRTTSSLDMRGCDLRALTASAEAGVRISGENNNIVNCAFDQTFWGVSPVLEVGSANNNVYNDNIGLNGNPGGVDSVFVGDRNTFNGLSQFRDTAATVNAFTTLRTEVATSGVQGIGTIKNTAANGMRVRETATDQFGVTSSVSTVVAAASDHLLDPTINIGTARPPYNNYVIEVQSENPGVPTTYVLRLGMNGEVTQS